MSASNKTEERWTANEDALEQRYYIWLTNLIPGWRTTHSKLIRRLYETAFRVTLLMDENRVGDGLSLRARFAYENGLINDEREILKARRPCSILEVMIGLALRFEEEYMTEYQDDNPIEKWISPMLDSLGLIYDSDSVFEQDQARVDMILAIFLNRAYHPDGRGGLFYIPGINSDMRNIELWQQLLMWNAYNKGGNLT